MRQMKNRKEKGITLIALVVTIIVLIILAGISINLIFGTNGIINKAKSSKTLTEQASLNEQIALSELDKELEEYNKYLPENTKDNQQVAGTEVKIPDGWCTTTPAYVSTEDGSIVKKSVKVASVTAVATGNGETVPVPIGFYYVGGTKDTGVVISDNPADKNKYASYIPTGEITEGIPAGVTYNEDGTVNEEKSELKGNQFVWIPCTASNYVKKTWGKNANGKDTWNATWESETNTAELPQIEKYGGFYIARYEAGTSNIKLSTGIDFASKNTASSWANDSFSIRDGLNQSVIEGKITSKAGEIPYYHADYKTALKLSNSMYQTDYVRSGLVTGTMWDAMMKFIAGGDDTIVTKSSWGNYKDGVVTYTAGKGRYTIFNSNSGETSAFTKSDGLYHYGIKTTAISEEVKKKNLYDVAGNLWEWTQEASYTNNTLESYMHRGGSFYDSYLDYPACYRINTAATRTSTNCGFRPVLYIK